MKFKGWFFGKMFVTNVTFIFCNFFVLVIHEQILCCDWLLNCNCIQCWFLFNCWKFWNHHHLILGCFEYTIDNSAHLWTTDYTTIGWNRRLNKILDIVVIYLIVMRVILWCNRWCYRPIWVLKIFSWEFSNLLHGITDTVLLACQNWRREFYRVMLT